MSARRDSEECGAFIGSALHTGKATGRRARVAVVLSARSPQGRPKRPGNIEPGKSIGRADGKYFRSVALIGSRNCYPFRHG